MICFSLNSGSNGNCIYVEAEGVRLLLDAGISGKRTAERLAERGRDVRDVDAVIISHDHIDHIRCAGVLARKFGLAVYMTLETHRRGRRYKLGRIEALRYFQAGDTLRFGAVRVETHPTAHDGVDPVSFVVAGDRGHISNVEAAEAVAAACDGRLQWVALSHLSEINNTPDLAAGTHRRIAGAGRPIHVASRHGPGQPLRIE